MKLKALIGILLIGLSIGGMFLWETRYRDEFTLVSVVAAAKDLKAGDIIDESCLKSVQIYPENLMSTSISISNVNDLIGMVCISDTYENEQLLLNRIAYKESLEPVETRIIVIPNTWIYMFSAQYVAGDYIEIYYMPERSYAGTYKISFVTENTVEIVCKLEEYYALYDRVMSLDTDGNSQRLMFVRME